MATVDLNRSTPLEAPPPAIPSKLEQVPDDAHRQRAQTRVPFVPQIQTAASWNLSDRTTEACPSMYIDQNHISSKKSRALSVATKQRDFHILEGRSLNCSTAHTRTISTLNFRQRPKRCPAFHYAKCNRSIQSNPI